MLEDKCKNNNIMWWQISVKSSNSIIKQFHARLLVLPNGNNVVIECVISNSKNNSSLCYGQSTSELASLMNLEYYFRYFTFGNALENMGNII